LSVLMIFIKNLVRPEFKSAPLLLDIEKAGEFLNMSNMIVEKTCNALYPNAEDGIAWGLQSLTSAFNKRIQGGLWVGGNFRAEPEWLCFDPGIFNTIANDRIEPVRIHASELRNIRRESGWGMDTIIIEHARGEFKFRCYGAEKVVNTLMSYYFRSAY
jgi:hypothetical protein